MVGLGYHPGGAGCCRCRSDQRRCSQSHGLPRVPPPVPSHRVTANPSRLRAPAHPARALAVGPNGNVYVADDLRYRCSRGVPTDFPVIAEAAPSASPGTTARHKGRSDNPQVSPSARATLYVADYGNGRIRPSPPRDHHDSSGDGQGSWVTNGTPALAAPLLPSAIAFVPTDSCTWRRTTRYYASGPTGLLPVGNPNSGEEGLFGVGPSHQWVPTPPTVGFRQEATSTSPLTKRSSCNAQHPECRCSAYPRAMCLHKPTTVLAMDELDLLRLTPQGEQTVVTFPTTDRTTYLGSQASRRMDRRGA